MPPVHAARRERAQQKIAELGADAALITSLPNVRYLTGMVSSNAALLLPAAGPGVLATDSRYAEAAARDCPDLALVVDRVIEPALASLAATRGLGTVAYEAQEMTVERHAQLAALDGGPALVPLGRVVEELRMVKDEAEIALLARACAITGEAFSAVLPKVTAGRTEREFAVLLERAMIDLGAEALAFDTIVASGPNGAIPHHVPGDRAFAAGDLITVDCGARYGGYHADMTRTVALGEPAAWQREIYELVATAQRAGVEAATAGADVRTVDAAARDLIAAAGHGDHFGHGLGHGVGLEVHEAPTISCGRTGTLGDRVPVTVEPGIYLPGRGGVRIEDTLVVRSRGDLGGSSPRADTDAGAAGSRQMLTTTTRDLLVL
jgi:Xaa-Pro aminopeptidase